jgi:hypothetical protein
MQQIKATRKPKALAQPELRTRVLLTQLDMAKIIFALCTEPDCDELMASLAVELAQTIIDEADARSFK